MYRLDRKIDKKRICQKHSWFFVGIFHYKNSSIPPEPRLFHCMYHHVRARDSN